MLDCADADLLGSVEDRRAYLPPKAIHGAEAEAAMRVPASIHNGPCSAQKAPVGARRNQGEPSSGCYYYLSHCSKNLGIRSAFEGNLGAAYSEYRFLGNVNRRGQESGPSGYTLGLRVEILIHRIEKTSMDFIGSCVFA